MYIIFTIEEVMTALGCADQKAGKLLHELESKCRLIERKRQGLGKPNLIYVKNFVDKAADNPVDNTSGSSTPSPESRFLNRENHDSGAVKITDQESLKSRSNNTDKNDTDFMVLLEQIKTIDKRRVRKYLGRMTRQQMDEIGEAIEEALGLYVPEEMEAP